MKRFPGVKAWTTEYTANTDYNKDVVILEKVAGLSSPTITEYTVTDGTCTMQDTNDAGAAAYTFEMEIWDEINNDASTNGFANLSTAEEVTQMLADIGHEKLGSRRLEATEDL